MPTLTELIVEDLGPSVGADVKREWWVCPFHSDSRPSLSVNEFNGREYYKCWSCGANGTSWDWLINHRHLSRKDAYDTLNGANGRTSVDSVRVQPPAAIVREPIAAEPPSLEWQSAAMTIANECADILFSEYPSVLRYLTAERGLTLETIQSARLGFNPHWRTLDDGSKLPPGITIPARVDGDLWYVRVRLTKDAAEFVGHKYMTMRGSVLTTLYNGEDIMTARRAIVTEGEFDALLLSQFVDRETAVVTPGSAASKVGPYWSWFLRHLDFVGIVTDDDEAGRLAMTRWAAELPNAIALSRPNGSTGKDVTDWHTGGVDLGEWIRGSIGIKYPCKMVQ